MVSTTRNRHVHSTRTRVWPKATLCLTILCAAASLVTATACRRAIAYPLVGRNDVYTLVNLHPDARRPMLWSVNFQQDGLIPLCTQVIIERVNRREMRFFVPSLNQRFSYRVHKTLNEPFMQHLDRFFGTQCNTPLAQQLSPLDQQGIASGQVIPGMTGQGVLLALGPPPIHATPNLNAPVWRYWRNRWATFDVIFTNGVVSEIR